MSGFAEISMLNDQIDRMQDLLDQRDQKILRLSMQVSLLKDEIAMLKADRDYWRVPWIGRLPRLFRQHTAKEQIESEASNDI